MKWPETITLKEAEDLQNRLRERVRIATLGREPETIAGVDAAYSKGSVFSAVCLYRFPELTLLEKKTAVRKLVFPYVPGYLFLREGPAIADAVRKLTVKPDLLLVDGQGIAHPRGMGIASYLGVLLGVPSIGCAKSRLVGEYEEPRREKGNWTGLRYEGKVIGAAVRTRKAVKPVFVSPGHLINLESSIRIVLAATGFWRVPEPLRCADMLSRVKTKERSLA